ncbi:MAG: lysophospholipid acyltransferase family protein [Alphaproteobacteria bacterium]|nr:lysophospholipid acyltransferase family protein [Alphaproteobacteria bacterium]
MTVKAKKESGLGSSFAGWVRLGIFAVLVVVLVPTFLGLRAVHSRRAKLMPIFFHKMLSRIVGIKVRTHGSVAKGEETAPVLFVCNHSSYMDIPVLGSVIQGSFVAKSEVSGWPFLGVMSKLQDTVFIERRTVRAAKQREVLRDNLEKGKSLILFPEGTSSDGMRTLPFKSTLFSIVEKPLTSGNMVKVQPVSVLCTEISGMPIGRSWRPYYAWFGDMTLVKHAWDVFKIASFTVDVIFHDPITIDDFGDRKLLSAHCERVIADGVDRCVTGRFKKKLAVKA